MAQITIGIIGLGRIGTSFGLAIRRYLTTGTPQHQITIIGSDDAAERRAIAKKRGAFDIEARTLEQAVVNSDLVVLAIPAFHYDEYYEAIGPDLKPGAVLIDLAPLKQVTIARAARWLPKDDQTGEPIAYAVPAHAVINPVYLYQPGDTPDHAHADLFDKGTLILSPDARMRGEAIQLASDFATLVGMQPHFTDPAEQDNLVAGMQALPLLTSLALFRTLHSHQAWDDLKRVVSLPFAMATAALVGQTAEDAAETMRSNRAETLRYLDRLRETLDEVRELLADPDQMLITEAFGESIERFEAWNDQQRIATWDAPQEAVIEKTNVGSMVTGRLFGRFGRSRAADDKDKSTS